MTMGAANNHSPQTQPMLTPAEVRARTIAQHTSLRLALADLRAAAMRMKDEGEGEEHLRAETLRLATQFEEHLRFEERHLVPLLPSLDAWGPARLGHLHAEHARQREQIGVFVQACRGEGCLDRAFPELVGLLVLELLEDMAIEEELLLHPDLLRDDIVAIDQTDG
jgi:hypothetical protein